MEGVKNTSTGLFQMWGGRPYFYPKNPMEWDKKFETNKTIDSLIDHAKERIKELQLSDTYNESIRFESIASCEIEKIYSPSDLVDNYYDVVEEISEIIPSIDSDQLLKWHKKLMMTDKRDRTSGKYRECNVKIGHEDGTFFYPIPHWDLSKSIDDFFEFANLSDKYMDPFIKLAIGHAFFECVHPFPDGNGRIGRILILWMMLRDGLISSSIEISPSIYFLKNQQEYYDRLNGYSNGDISGWVEFFLKALVYKE